MLLVRFRGYFPQFLFYGFANTDSVYRDPWKQHNGMILLTGLDWKNSHSKLL